MLEGIVTSDDFRSTFFGNIISNRNVNTHVGQAREHYMSPYCHQVAMDILKNEGNIELTEKFEARKVNFIYDNEEHTSYGIFKKEVI